MAPSRASAPREIAIANPAFAADERPGVEVIGVHVEDGIDVENGIEMMVDFVEIAVARLGFDENVDAGDCAGKLEEIEEFEP